MAGIGAAGDQVRQEGVGVGRAGAAGELAVGKGAGPAFAEEDVAAGIEVVALQELADILETPAYVAALLEDRPPGSLCAEAQGRSHAGGPAADDGDAGAGGTVTGLRTAPAAGDAPTGIRRGRNPSGRRRAAETRGCLSAPSKANSRV